MTSPFLLAASNPLTHVIDHPIWAPGGFYILSTHMVMLLIAGGLMWLVFPWLTKPYQDGKLVPTGTRNFFEAILMFVRDDVAKPVLGHEVDRFMPLLWTLFFFILFCNLLGLLPLDLITTGRLFGVESSSWHGIYGTATSNFAVTLMLALIVFSVVQYQGIKANGFGGWAKHFLGGAPLWLAPIMIPVELLGMVIKPFALAVRLAANMTAGHILLAVIIGFVPAALIGLESVNWGTGLPVALIAIIAAVGVMCFEVFVAFLQAYLFTFLAGLFISQMVVHHGEEGHHDGSIDEFAPPEAFREGHEHHGIVTHQKQQAAAH